jgi:ribosomal protein L37AE/L43A
MSSTETARPASESSQGKLIKKRQYSRNGCKECKRRKLKCDEGKPECWQCSHLGKKCAYVNVIKFSESRNIFMKKNNINKKRGGNEQKPPFVTHSQTIDFDKGTDVTNHTVLDETSTRNEDDALDTNIEDEQLSHTGGDFKFEDFIPQNISPGIERENIINEASNLANDIFESITNIPDFVFDDFLNIDLTLSDFEKKQNIIDSFDLQEPHKAHLEVFYDKISTWLFPLDPTLCNEILLYHAKNCSYLLASMLSLATEDEKLKERYISTCLQTLNQVFQDTQTNILNNIESLLLTVLLLAADSTSISWRAHLRGAKDLFLKYTKYYQTPSLLFARSWFAAIEILANLQSIGTVKIHDEIDELLDVGLYGNDSEFAIDVGILLPDGYNMFLGYSSDAIIMYREFCKLKKDDPNGFLFQMSLIHNAKEFQVASKDILISKDNPAHPDYEDQGADADSKKLILPSSCYGFTDDNAVFSWFDLIHQLHVDALLLKIYSEYLKLDKSSKIIQNLVDEMFSLCFFFYQSGDTFSITDPNDTRLLMCHGPFLTMGLNTVRHDHKEKVTTYFDSLVELGVKSAKVLIKKVQNNWNGNSDGDVLLIPFA